MKYKEDVLDALICNTLKLSGKDHQFFVGLEWYRSKNLFITSKQAELFDFLISKYQKQWKKANIDVNDLLNLTWETNVKTTSDTFTSAKISLEDGKICVVSPYNQKFVNLTNVEKDYPIEWVKQKSRYEGRFSTLNLKRVVNDVKNHFSCVEYCDRIQQIMSTVEKLDAKYWNPTLVKSNGNFYIAAINGILAKYVEDIDLSDDSDTVKRLRSMGITISEDICIDQIDEQKSQDNSKRRSKL